MKMAKIQQIQFYRGVEANRLTVTPVAGEPLWATDSQKLYMGDGATAGGIDFMSIALGNYILSTEKGAINGVATLDGAGKVPTSQLPALAITDTFVVASQAAMLALTAQTGDVAVRTDENKSYILQGSDSTNLADWVELLSPTAPATNLAYVASPTDGQVTSSTGTAATLTLAGAVNAGLMSPTDFSKLAGIASGAQVNVQSDWNAGSGDAFIQNKPTDLTDLSTHNITELSDVSVVTPSVGDYLRWDGSQFANVAAPTYAIDDLTDVDTSTVAPTSGQVLKWDGSNWVPGDDSSTIASIDDVGDVNITGATEGQAMIWNNTAGEWQNQTLPSGVTTFAGLSDTPGAYTGEANKIVIVNAAENALEFTNVIDGGSF